MLTLLNVAAKEGDWPKVRQLDRMIVEQFTLLKPQCTSQQREVLAKRIKSVYKVTQSELKNRMEHAQSSMIQLKQSQEGMAAYSGAQELLR